MPFQEGQDPDLDPTDSIDVNAGYKPPDTEDPEPAPPPDDYSDPPVAGLIPPNLPGGGHAVGYYLDKAGNRQQVTDTANPTATYTANNINQYSSVSGCTISNGPEHQVSAFQSPNDTIPVNYYYINDEHLKQVSDVANNYYLYYDALGRCVRRNLNGTTTYYIYDGEKPILEYTSSTGIVGRNVYGKGIDEILMRTDPGVNNGYPFYYAQDHEGSVTHLLDGRSTPSSQTGNVIEKYAYDAFGAPKFYDANGNPLNPNCTAYDNRFLFTGREYGATYRQIYVSTFSFYEYRARAYNPTLGRFMSEDPKLFDAGDYNLFRYCHNDPIDFTDPMGTDEAAPVHSPREESLERKENLSASQAVWQRQMNFSNSYGAIAAGLRAFHVEQSPMQSFLKLRAWVQQYRHTPIGKLLDQGIEAVAMTEGGSFKVANPVPTMLARAVPGMRRLLTLGRPGDKEVFVTAASDLKGLQASQLGQRLGKPNSGTWTIIRFPAPATGLASPVFRNNPGFVPGGLTSGGAREFVIPNGPIPPNATIEIIGGGH